ncbi:Aste57867_13893 [Aphanomyces stellatus]|uniref:Aste57867_13893 protein n=1 Tax=Aphanomyces stellatus TaxID=120398 RepID=A0A485KZB6_9STRA|nr:hypothetical protein As57867_013842 [Aphanomyces stellatus]VFT90724.1 Aste57867_13893 [Aphanomyces stellatus]
MTKKSGAKHAKATSAAKEVDTIAVVLEEKSLPGILRIVLICMTSIMAERAWQNREVLTQHLYNDNQTPTQQTMISVFAYFALMGAIFVCGVVMSKATTFLARFF